MDIIDIPVIALAAVAFISPLISAVVIQNKWGPKVKNAIAFVVALLLSVGVLLLNGGIGDWTDLAVAVPAVFGLQQLVYRQFLEHFSKKIQIATDRTKGHEVVVNTQVAEDSDGNRVVAGEPDDVTVVLTPDKDETRVVG